MQEDRTCPRLLVLASSEQGLLGAFMPPKCILMAEDRDGAKMPPWQDLEVIFLGLSDLFVGSALEPSLSRPQ